jgi:hypothetical protein
VSAYQPESFFFHCYTTTICKKKIQLNCKKNVISTGLGSNWWWTSGKEYYNSWIWTNTGELFFGEDEKWATGQPFTGSCFCVCLRASFNGLTSQNCNTGNNIICEAKPAV